MKFTTFLGFSRNYTSTQMCKTIQSTLVFALNQPNNEDFTAYLTAKVPSFMEAGKDLEGFCANERPPETLLTQLLKSVLRNKQRPKFIACGCF